MKRHASRLSQLRMRREQIEREVAGPLIAERDRATSWARQAESRARSEEENRKSAERLFSSDIGKYASREVQHCIAQEISQHAMRAAVATVNQTMENGDYVIRICVPALSIERRFARHSIDDAPRAPYDRVMGTEEMTVRSVRVDTARRRP